VNNTANATDTKPKAAVQATAAGWGQLYAAAAEKPPEAQKKTEEKAARASTAGYQEVDA
jgi:hypothetical protein